MFELADKLKELKESKRQTEDDLKTINASIDETEKKLSDLMVDNETQSFKRSGTLFYLNTKTYASAVAEQKQDLYQTLKNNGFGSMVTETVNANSLSAFVKEQMSENNDLLPDWLGGLVTVFEKTSVGVRKG